MTEYPNFMDASVMQWMMGEEYEVLYRARVTYPRLHCSGGWKMGSAVGRRQQQKVAATHWIGDILKRLHLMDDGRRKRSPEGMTYAIHSGEVRDMMRRYDVVPIENANG